jgi:uncharacterized protein (UPF0333 family)
MSDWVNIFPYIFFPFKVIVVAIGMYYAIKWHYDQGKLKREAEAAAKAEIEAHPQA